WPNCHQGGMKKPASWSNSRCGRIQNGYRVSGRETAILTS
ncbi:MAG: hypothetical protein AVDCRST_MAG93-6802, partial [uncultured Chloroflexia bacterium]